MHKLLPLSAAMLISLGWPQAASAEGRETDVHITWTQRQPTLELLTPDNEPAELSYDPATRAFRGTVPAQRGWSRLTIHYPASEGLPPDSYQLLVDLSLKRQITFNIPWPTPRLAACNLAAHNQLNEVQSSYHASLWFALQARSLLRRRPPSHDACGQVMRPRVQAAQNAREQEVVGRLFYLNLPLFGK